MLRDHGRFKYSAIVDRPDYTWPEGKRLAFYVALNMEHFSYGEGLGISMSPGIPHPNTYNWAWREYGNRVGVWRLLDLFTDLELPISVLLNSEVYDHCPEVVAAFRAPRLMKSSATAAPIPSIRTTLTRPARRRSSGKPPKPSQGTKAGRRPAGSAPGSTPAT